MATTQCGSATSAGKEWIGHAIDELPTPVLTLDISVATRNATLMGERFLDLPSALRPHVKAHKCAELAHLQLAHGAIGVTTATVAEAAAMVDDGIEDILIANEVVDPPGLDVLMQTAERARMCVAIDDADALNQLSRRARQAGATVGVVVEFDVGMGRGGTRTVEQALVLGEAAARLPGVQLRGLMGYEGHCTSDPDPSSRAREARASMARLIELADRFRASGLPVDVVTAGATGTYAVTGSYPGVTEVQAGSYLLMDGFHEPLVEGFDFALHVVTTAISVHDGLAVFDAGRKAVGGDFGPPRPPVAGGSAAFLHEEHVGFRCDERASFRVGDRAALVPAYAPTAVNLFPAYHVVEQGRIVDVWQVRARHGER
jgi:D-serine deaminase-like pyridoxal phosphate-dependent protein